MRIIFFISTLLFFTAPCLSQDLTKEKEVNNLFSIAAGGTPTTIGITYERILNNRKVSLEIGGGLLGGGLGLNFYPFKSFDKEQFNHFVGVRSSYNIQGSGGSRIVNYLPIGTNYLGSKKLYFSIDLGPALVVQLTHNGHIPFYQPQPDYPEYSFGVYGGLKLGFGF
jgi:hypothetical protein